MSNFCVFVPSHITNCKRIQTLKKCVDSLKKQSTRIHVYLSVSFESEICREVFTKYEFEVENKEWLTIFLQREKTSQFQHLKILLEKCKNKHKFVFFCDDDDTYHPYRVEMFMTGIGKSNFTPSGIYEGLHGSHSKHFYEYWSYCVNIRVLELFFHELEKHKLNKYVNHVFCDFLFAHYLRHLSSDHYFLRIDVNLYNYNTEDKTSITGKIQEQNNKPKQISCLRETLDTTKQNMFLLFFRRTLEQIKKETFSCFLNEQSKSELIELSGLSELFLTMINELKDKSYVKQLEDSFNEYKQLGITLFQQ